MIGRDDGDIAGGEVIPKCFDLAPRPERRIDFGLAAEPAHIVLFVERQIMDAGLDRCAVSLRAIGGRQLIAAADRTVHDMHRAAGAGTEFKDLGSRQRLR